MCNWNIGLYISLIPLSIVIFIISYIIIIVLFLTLTAIFKSKKMKKVFDLICVSHTTFDFFGKLFIICGIIFVVFFFPSRYISIRKNLVNKFTEEFKNEKFYFATAGGNGFFSINPILSDDQKTLIDGQTKYFLTSIKKTDIHEFVIRQTNDFLEELIIKKQTEDKK